MLIKNFLPFVTATRHVYTLMDTFLTPATRHAQIQTNDASAPLTAQHRKVPKEN